MPTTLHDEPYCKTLEFIATAAWRWHDVPASDDLAATAFGPARSQQWIPPGLQGSGIEPVPAQVAKPVLYIPVKKQNGKETFPALRIHLTVTELGGLRNVRVPGHQDAPVEIRVWNVWGGKRVGPIKLKGALGAKDACAIVVPAATVQKWLDPNGELGGRVNELLLDF